MSMTNDEINEYIYVQIMAETLNHRLADRRSFCILCAWHNVNPAERCLSAEIPDYCSDDSPRSLLNEVIIAVVEGGAKVPVHQFFYGTDDGIVALTAEQIARACVAAHQEAT